VGYPPALSPLGTTSHCISELNLVWGSAVERKRGMPVELSQLMQLARGKPPALQVGDLPRPVAEYLKCHPAIVWLGTPELRKIVNKHSPIRVEQLQRLPLAMQDARYYLEPARPHCVTAFYFEPTSERQYILGLKPASHGSEVWVQTFFYIDNKKAARKQDRCTFLYARKGWQAPHT
jgi:hypothetical protein